MSDIFQEVDEDVRRERLQKLWERYNIYIIIAAALIIAAVAGWRTYEWREARKAAVASAAFEAAVTLSEAGKHVDAETAFAGIAADAPAGYRMLARLRVAAELAQTDTKKAIEAYDAIAADSSVGSTVQELASIRAGMLLVDTAQLSELRRRLDPLTEPARPFRHSARELLALSAWRNNDVAAARKYIDMIAADGETPPGTRTRMDVLSALIAADGKS